jgi:uncharacterized protein
MHRTTPAKFGSDRSKLKLKFRSSKKANKLMAECVRTHSVLPADSLEWLAERLGSKQALRRLAIESDYEAKMMREHGERWSFIARKLLALSGLYTRGRENAERIQVKHHTVRAANLPSTFDGFKILHISDLHIDLNLGVIPAFLQIANQLRFDVCVLTGDYRGKTFGPFEEAMEALTSLRSGLGDRIYGVLGNHDSVRMIPSLEQMGVQMLLNESVTISRGNQRLYLAGIDDAHLYRTHDIEKASSQIPADSFSILLSHTPEVYEQAAQAAFDLLLSGHTHGGQICLPGAIPLTLCADLPRRMGAGRWKYDEMIGYTSVGLGSSLVPIRFNCPPEITLHHLQCQP